MMPGNIGCFARSRAIRFSRISSFTDRRATRAAPTAERSSESVEGSPEVIGHLTTNRICSLSPQRHDRPLVYAHRGGAALRPENTIASFDHGLSLGADGLEFDVRLSRDGVVVVHHDASLERTTNGRGSLASCTADELAQVDAGHGFTPADKARTKGSDPVSHPYRGQGHDIPRLQQV